MADDIARLASFIDGERLPPAGGDAGTTLASPIDGRTYAFLEEASAATLDHAVRSAEAAYRANRRSTTAQRSQWLNAAAGAIDGATEEIISLLIADIGKPRRAATFEATRSAQFVRACAAQALTLGGETLPVDAAATGAGRLGFVWRVPFGVVGAITPFNAPINLLVQKVAPAIAAGNAVIVKPAPTATRVALRVAELFVKAGLPRGLFNVVTGDREAALALAGHPGVAAITFTGGTAAGDALARAAGAKKFVAELGSNAANIVLADADIADAAKRIAAAAFEASGQQCISAQRIIVEAPVYDAFLAEFVAAAKALKMGEPSDPNVDLGPMVSTVAADRVMRMVDDLTRRGGRFALVPERRECYISPGIAVDAPREASLWCDEVFGPLALVERAADADAALALANDSPFGLQGALFTRSLGATFRFVRDFEVGSLWVNEASRFRLDMYPFGGVKRSGHGREGVRYAIEEMSQLKFVGVRFEE